MRNENVNGKLKCILRMIKFQIMQIMNLNNWIYSDWKYPITDLENKKVNSTSKLKRLIIHSFANTVACRNESYCMQLYLITFCPQFHFIGCGASKNILCAARIISCYIGSEVTNCHRLIVYFGSCAHVPVILMAIRTIFNYI